MSEGCGAASAAAAAATIVRWPGVWTFDRLTRDKDRIVETLDIIKFICRVFWKEVFQKQVDKLQTNHKVRACVITCS